MEQQKSKKEPPPPCCDEAYKASAVRMATEQGWELKEAARGLDI